MVSFFSFPAPRRIQRGGGGPALSTRVGTATPASPHPPTLTAWPGRFPPSPWTGAASGPGPPGPAVERWARKREKHVLMGASARFPPPPSRAAPHTQKHRLPTPTAVLVSREATWLYWKVPVRPPYRSSGGGERMSGGGACEGDRAPRFFFFFLFLRVVDLSLPLARPPAPLPPHPTAPTPRPRTPAGPVDVAKGGDGGGGHGFVGGRVVNK